METAGDANAVKVFISHAHRDRWIATQVETGLASVPGIHAFRDAKDIPGGVRIPDALREALRDADELVVLLSAASRVRDWVLVEIGAAWVLGTPTVLLLDKLDHDDVPDVVRHVRRYDLNEFPDYLRDVARRAGSRE